LSPYVPSNLGGYQFVDQEILNILSLLYTFLLQPIHNVKCDEFFVINLIIFVLSRFTTNLLAANHLII